MIDELPIFLKRVLHDDSDAKRVDEFLSWLRGAIQALGDQGPVFIVSGRLLKTDERPTPSPPSASSTPACSSQTTRSGGNS